MSKVLRDFIRKVQNIYHSGIQLINNTKISMKEKKLFKQWFTNESYKFMKEWCKDLNCTMVDFFEACENMGISKDRIMQIDDDLYNKLWIYVVDKHHTDKYIVEKKNKKLYISKFDIRATNSFKKELVIPA